LVLSVAAEELLKTNNAKFESYPFDWAQSNILSVIDIIKYGHEYNMNNNIYNVGLVKYDKQFKNLHYPHHTDKGYMERCSKRFFERLNEQKMITFFYMANLEGFSISNRELNILIKTLEDKYENLIFEIIIAYYLKNGNSVKIVEQNEKYKIFHCESPHQFHSIPWEYMNNSFFKNLFKLLFLSN
jgi:hypothetical protein